MAKPPRTAPSPRSKPKHRLRKALVVLALIAVGFVAALPTLLSTAPGRTWLVGLVNAKLRPGSIKLEGLSLGWNGPIELTGLALIDPHDKAVVQVKAVRLDRGIIGLLTARPDYGTITLEGLNLDVERKADGTIDLRDAVASLMGPGTNPTPAAPPAVAANPIPPAAADPTRVDVVIKDGKLRLASPELVEPITAATMDGSIHIAPGEAIALKLDLGDEGRSIAVEGQVGRDAATDSALTLTSKAWPFHVAQGGMKTRGRLEGTIAASRKQGLWATTGDAAILGLEADGPALKGDRLACDRLTLGCDLGQAPGGWAVRKLDLKAPFGSLQGQGAWPTLDGSPTVLRGTVDLARLAKMLPNAMQLRDNLSIDRGVVNIRADLRLVEGLEKIELAMSVDDLLAVENGKTVMIAVPPRLNATATRARDKVKLESLEIQAAGIDVKAGGDLDAGVNLAGTIDLAALHAQLASVLDLGALDFSGQGQVVADYKKAGETYQARLALGARDLAIVGLTAEPIKRDTARLDLAATGPRQPDGLPSDWHSARLDLKAGDLGVDLLASSHPDAIALNATIVLPLTSPAPGKGRVEAKLSIHPTEKTCEIPDLRFWLVPDGPNAAAGTLGCGVQGKADLARGVANLQPIAGLPAGALALAPDGLKLSGLGKANESLKVDVALQGDLAALDNLQAAWTGAPPKGMTPGTWSARLSGSKATTGVIDLATSIDLADLVETGPASLALKVAYTPKVDRVDLPNFDLKTHYGRVVATGRLEDASTARHSALDGTIEPAWDVIRPLLAGKTDPNARIEATMRPFHMDGSLKADTTGQLLSQISAVVGLDLTTLDMMGVKVGATPVVVRMGGGQTNFDPIKTTINDGPTTIQADVGVDDKLGVWLHIKGGSKIDDAVINDKMSDELLSFVAPMLKQSSQVRGKVSVGLGGATLPITAAGGGTKVQGHVVFKEVEFKPGPMGTQFTSITGRPVPRLALNQDVQIVVADGRVTQSGLSIPIGGDGLHVNMEGSVGFDKSLDARVTVPLTASMLGKDQRLQKLVDGMKVTLPLTGTLSRPQLDPRALQVALRDAGKVMVERGLKDEAAGLLDKVGGSDADAIKGLLDGLGGRKKK